MLLRKIKYHNFRPFYGDQEVDLTPVDNNNANVIVILGDNTFGKSTFVLSFIWCLYGESRFNRPNDILNKKVEAKMSFSQQETASVEIEFEEDGKLYNVKRTQLFTMGQNNKLNTTKSEVKMTYVENNEVKNFNPRLIALTHQFLTRIGNTRCTGVSYQRNVDTFF